MGCLRLLWRSGKAPETPYSVVTGYSARHLGGDLALIGFAIVLFAIVLFAFAIWHNHVNHTSGYRASNANSGFHRACRDTHSRTNGRAYNFTHQTTLQATD